MNWGDCVLNGVPTISCITPVFHIALGTAISLIGTVSVILIIVAGIKFITSGGGKQVDEAKNMITYAIIGLVIVLVAFFIINLVSGITGITCIMSFGFSSCGLLSP